MIYILYCASLRDTIIYFKAANRLNLKCSHPIMFENSFYQYSLENYKTKLFLTKYIFHHTWEMKLLLKIMNSEILPARILK